MCSISNLTCSATVQRILSPLSELLLLCGLRQPDPKSAKAAAARIPAGALQVAGLEYGIQVDTQGFITFAPEFSLSLAKKANKGIPILMAIFPRHIKYTQAS